VTVPAALAASPEQRVAGADWAAIAAELGAVGCALTPPLVTATSTGSWSSRSRW
jgi:hypothetical protein